MKPMEPMAPMKPMGSGPPWWPEGLGHPSSTGPQNGVRYAFFSDARRLAIERNGKMELYNSGDHQISGVSQPQGSGATLTFSSQGGDVMIEELNKVE